MNLPNKLTMLRVILIPFFIYFLLNASMGNFGPESWIALAIFCVASITDFLDGQIARRMNLVTNFGKFMDPLADKLLVSSALICFVELGILPAWMVIVIISREFIISGFRLIASDNGVVIAASWWGKIKTVFQMLTIIFIIVYMGLGRKLYWGDIFLCEYIQDSVNSVDISVMGYIGSGLIWISLILTVVSLIDYIVKNKDIMKDKK